MTTDLLAILRCPFCGTALDVVDNAALRRVNGAIEAGVLGCQCCAFPVVAGIPVLLADDRVRDAMHALEAGHEDAALARLLDLDDVRRKAFEAAMAGPRPTYRDVLAILSQDAEGTYFVYRFSDPTYVAAQGLVRALTQHPRLGRRTIDVCGGSGHLTRDLLAARPRGGVVLADVYFAKLWLAARFVAPGCEPVCCDGNAPLPFAPDTFSLAVLSDAFPYIWHKRLLADELVRLAGAEGVVAMPHLHSSLGFNHSAGMTLTPAAYRELFAPLGPRLFRDRQLLDGVLDHGTVDLSQDVSADDIGDEPAVTLVASRLDDVFTPHVLPEATGVTGELRVNPLYLIEWDGRGSTLTLTFPTPEYEEEFGECRRFLPERVAVAADLRGSLTPSLVGGDYAELRRRRVLIDAPLAYY
jgi:uncharacterized protein YbaR (Trm112 family)